MTNRARLVTRVFAVLTWLSGLAGPVWAMPANTESPAPPVILGVSAPGLLSGADAQPEGWPGVEVMGVAEPGMRLQLWMRGPQDAELYPIAWFRADHAGRWQCEAGLLEPGCYTFRVGGYDVAGHWAWGRDLQTEIVPGRLQEVVVLQAGAADENPQDGLLCLDAPVADTSLRGWLPQRNYGGDTRLSVRYGVEESALLRFDLSALPPGLRIERAALAFYATSRSNPHPLAIEAYRVRSDWVDSEATCVYASASCPWQLPGANGEADRDQSPVSRAVVAVNRPWCILEATDLAREWYRSPSSNDGVLLKGAPDISVGYDFASSEYPDWRLRPMLWLVVTADFE